MGGHKPRQVRILPLAFFQLGGRGVVRGDGLQVGCRVGRIIRVGLIPPGYQHCEHS